MSQYDAYKNCHDSFIDAVKEVGKMMKKQCLKESHGYCALCGTKCRRPQWLMSEKK